jgi:pyruvate-ferredoxin/flavodoxin oxidoreductase
MPSFAEIAGRIYRQLLGLHAAPQGDEAGITTLLEGSVAVATVEAILSEAAATGESFPPEHGGIAWRGEQQRQQFNLFGQPLLQIVNQSPRAALSSAMGLAMAGKRTHCSLWSSDLAAAQDLLRRAAGHHLPLVIHTINRALPLQGESRGGSHQALHQLRESGACILFAQNGQQVVDFTLVAHAVAEQALVPVVVAMDGDETAFSMQQLQLPSPQLIERLVGQSSDSITLEDPAQRMLFGETRRRIPRWHNLDRPTLQGSYQDPYSFALGEISHTQFFGKPVATLLEQTFAQLHALSGREYGPLSYHGPYKSRRLLVTQGAMSERCQQIADLLNQRRGGDLAVVGIQQLSPAPTAALRRLLQRADEITVLDSVEPLLGDDAPLHRQVAALASPSCRIHSILYGIGGLPVQSRDLLAACQLPLSAPAGALRLGIDPLPAHNNPKQQVLHDLLGRHYPKLRELGVRGTQPLTLLPEEALTIAILHRNGTGERTLSVELAHQLYHAHPGAIRSQQQSSWSEWGESHVDCFSYSTTALGGPLDPQQPIDIALLCGHRPQQGIPTLERMQHTTQLLIDPGTLSRDEYLAALPGSTTTQLHQLGVQLYFIDYSAEGRESTEAARAERCGALFSLILHSQRLELREGRLVEQYPQPQQRALFQSALEPLQPTVLQQPTEQNTPFTAQTPMAVRHLAHDSETSAEGYHSLSRFWDQNGVLYRDGDVSKQRIDPFIATGHIPPLSSTFNNHSNQTAALPLFDPAHCSGCGACWSHCPDSAIGATVLSPTRLLEAGLQMGGADALRPHLSKLTKVLSTITESGDSGILIRQGWTILMEQAPLAADRRAAADAAIETLSNNLGTMPLVLTETLFHAQERSKPQAGELLTLVINPDSCKGCGICSALCQQQAARQQQEHAALTTTSEPIELAAYYRRWRVWEQLPDTRSETLIELAAHPEMGPLSATLLSRYAGMAIAGGDRAEPGSGEKLALRQLLAITEYLQQPQIHLQLQRLERLYQQLMERIRQQLAVASHIDDLSALAAGLGELSNRNLTLTTLAEKTAGIESEGVDAFLLKETIELADAIQREQQQIASGDQSLGRARYSLLFASGSAASWAGNFPFNPFQVPVTISGAAEVAAMAAGLMEGQLEQATATQQLIHKAENLLKSGSAAERKRFDQLGWRDLTDDEHQQCAPLLLVGNDSTMGAAGSAGLQWLLNSDLPVKVILLAELELGFAGEQGLHGSQHHARDSHSELTLSALAQRNAFVAHCSIAHPDHLNQTMRDALRYRGPALLRIHTPSPLRHGFSSAETVHHAARAVAARAFPLLRYNPQLPGVFGTRITLEGNPDTAIPICDWALQEGRFSGLFEPLRGHKSPTPLEQWLTLDRRGQGNKTPTATLNGDDYTIDVTFARRLGQLLEQWQMLQELAGVVTPFTAQVEQQAESRVATRHQAELEALQQAHQQELQRVREQLESEVSERITARLVALTESYQPSAQEAAQPPSQEEHRH